MFPDKSFKDHTEYQTLRATLKYKTLASINAFQNNFKGRDDFYFRELEKEKIQKEMHKLNSNKVSQHSDIPTKIIKSSSDIFRDFLYINRNGSIKYFLFQSCLKTVEITPIYKKGKKDLKDNYRSSRIFTGFVKIMSKKHVQANLQVF